MVVCCSANRSNGGAYKRLRGKVTLTEDNREKHIYVPDESVKDRAAEIIKKHFPDDIQEAYAIVLFMEHAIREEMKEMGFELGEVNFHVKNSSGKGDHEKV